MSHHINDVFMMYFLFFSINLSKQTSVHVSFMRFSVLITQDHLQYRRLVASWFIQNDKRCIKVTLKSSISILNVCLNESVTAVWVQKWLWLITYWIKVLGLKFSRIVAEHEWRWRHCGTSFLHLGRRKTARTLSSSPNLVKMYPSVWNSEILTWNVSEIQPPHRWDSYPKLWLKTSEKCKLKGDVSF